MYLSSKILRILDSNKQKFIGTQSPSKLKNDLQQIFKCFNLFVSMRKLKLDENFGYILGASYDSDIDEIGIDIFLENDNFQFSLSEKEWKLFRFKMSQIIQHELIHREQYKKKNVEGFYSVSNARSYLSNPDEIDAYSHDIAMEILYFYGESQKYKIIRNISRKKEVESYIMYENTFKNSNWESIRKKLIKKTYLWLNYVNI